jgi:hypothetical protein
LKRKKSAAEKIELPDSIERDEMFSHKDADPSMNVAQRGITIDFNEDPQNVLDSILCSCESDSNEIEESDLHQKKLFEPRVSTQRGITIDCNEENENALDSILCSCESDSNEIEESDLQ